MYACTECDRKYESRNSLTRHMHNHLKNKKHSCSLCGVVFRRRDLLLRHSKLHKLPSLGSTSAASAAPSEFNAGRKRCHTACVRCRELRTRCNGQHPCFTCVDAGARCVYGHHSHRLSHPASAEPGHLSAVSFPEPDFTGPENLLEFQSEHEQLEQRHAEREQDQACDPPSRSIGCGDAEQNSVNTDSAFPSATTIQHAFPSDMNDALSEAAAQSPIPADWNASVLAATTDTVYWPQLHEDLYLPPDLDTFPNAFAPFSLQYFGDGLFSQLTQNTLPPVQALAGQNDETSTIANAFYGPSNQNSFTESTGHPNNVGLDGKISLRNLPTSSLLHPDVAQGVQSGISPFSCECRC